MFEADQRVLDLMNKRAKEIEAATKKPNIARKNVVRMDYIGSEGGGIKVN